MPSPNTSPSSNYVQAAKNPAAYVLVLLASLLSSVVTVLVRGDSKGNDRNGDCQQQLLVWQRMYKTKDSAEAATNYELRKERAVQAEIPRAVDSLRRRP